MSRGGIIFQPIVFEPGTVTTLSPVPPGGEVGGTGTGGAPSGGGGSALGPILAGLLLALAALGFPLAGVGPGPTTPPAAAPSPAVAPAAPPGAVPSPAAVPAPGAAPSPPGPVALVSPPSGKPAERVTAPGPPPVSRGRRPVLPFTGANLATPMVVGAGLIALGLVLRRAEDLSRSAQ